MFDPGVNALSILTEVLQAPLFVAAARLEVPANCEAPIAAELELRTGENGAIHAAFDFRQTGPQTWDIDLEAEDGGRLKLSKGGARLAIDGAEIALNESESEYTALYRRFGELISQGRSDVDARPFELVADAFLIGARAETAPFLD